jgi:hypothetical protein
MKAFGNRVKDVKEGDAKSPQLTLELRREASVRAMCADSVGKGHVDSGRRAGSPSSL